MIRRILFSPLINSRWLPVALYMLAIYSTLGEVRPVAGFFRQAGCLGFLTSFLLIVSGCAVIYLTSYKSTRNLRRVSAVICFMLAVSLALDFPEERIHLLEYGLAGWLCAWAAAGSGWWPRRWPVVVIIVFMLGLGDEIIQYFLPGRVYDDRDVLLNFLSGSCGMVIYSQR